MQWMEEIKRSPILAEREKRYHFNAIGGIIAPAVWMTVHTVVFNLSRIPVLSQLGIIVSLVMCFNIFLAHRQKYLLSSSVNAIIHLAFIGAGMAIIGWKSGMQFHLIAMGVMVQIHIKGHGAFKLFIGAAMYFAILAAGIYTAFEAPMFPMPSPYIDYLLFFNIAFSMCIIFFLNTHGNILEQVEENLFQAGVKNEQLLHNILPGAVAKELRETGSVKPAWFEEVTIMFSDFKGFTNIVATVPTRKLIEELNDIFSEFDDIIDSEGIEKIQTVGDGYLAACGLPTNVPDHAVRCVRAAKKMIDYLNKRNETHAIKWKVRIGLHSGPISAGVIGKRKFAYDIFGDTINTASRIESNGEENRINVSAYTYDLIKETFPCVYRGKLNAKGKGELDMYFVK